MYNNYDYPAGADTSDAPYNQVDPPEKAFDIWYSTCMSRNADITTNDYDDSGPISC